MEEKTLKWTMDVYSELTVLYLVRTVTKYLAIWVQTVQDKMKGASNNQCTLIYSKGDEHQITTEFVSKYCLTIYSNLKNIYLRQQWHSGEFASYHQNCKQQILTTKVQGQKLPWLGYHLSVLSRKSLHSFAYNQFEMDENSDLL